MSDSAGALPKWRMYLEIEGQVFELALGGTLSGILCWSRGCTGYSRKESLGGRFNDQNCTV